MSGPREKTHQLLEMIDDGIVDRDYVISACLCYMSESEVADMMRQNELDPDMWEDCNE